MDDYSENPESEAIRRGIEKWSALSRRIGLVVMVIWGMLFVAATTTMVVLTIIEGASLVAFLVAEVFFLAIFGFLFYFMSLIS